MRKSTGAISLKKVDIEIDEPFLIHLFFQLYSEDDAWNSIDVQQREMLLDMQYRAQKQQYSVTFPEAEHYLIAIEDRLIGRLMIDRTKNEISCVDITILKEFRGKGIGTELLEKLIEESNESGRVFSLSVQKTNPAARLYKRLGLSVVKDEGVYWKMESQIELE